MLLGRIFKFMIRDGAICVVDVAGRTTTYGDGSPVRKAGRRVAHHYDLSARLYDLFLDRDRQYSCA